VARLLGEARVSILPDGTRFKPEAEAAVKKATAGLNGKVKLDLDTKGMDAQIAAEGAKIIAMQNRIAKARATDERNAEKEITARGKMYASMFDQIGKSEAMLAAREAVSSQKQQDSIGRIARARQDDLLSQQKGISNTQNMYSKMFDEISKSEAMLAAREAASSKAQQDSVNRIAKAREADILSQQKGISDTQNMYSKMFDELNKRDKVKVNVDGSLAEVETLSLRERLKATLRDIKAKVTVDRNSLRNSASAILGFFGGRFARDLEGSGNSGGKKFGGGFISGLGKSALMQNPGITAAVIAGLAALPAAIGAIGVLGGIALGAGLIIGAQKLVKSQVKTLTASLKTLTSAVGKPAAPTTLASQGLAIQGTQATIARLEATKKLTAAQVTQLSIAKQRLGIEQATLAASQKQGGGTAAQKQQIAAQQAQLAQWKQQLAAFNGLNAAVARLKLGFTQFAATVTRPLLKPFTNAVDELDRQLKGPLGKDFTDLFKAVAPLVKPVETSLLEIVKGILPGMTDMLHKAKGPLSDMFIGFGKIIGLHLGQWFRDAAPFIKDSSHYLLMLLDILGKAGSFLIKFGGQLAHAFAGPQFKGIGKLIGEIASDILNLLVPAFQGWTGVMGPVVKELLELMVPILDFLAKHPALVKAIFSLIAAYMLFRKALMLVDVSLAITDALEIGGVWGFVALAIIAAALLIIKYWKPISGFFVMIWKHIWSGFIKPFTEGILGLVVFALRAYKVLVDGILSAIGLIIHGAADAFGWIPGIGSKLRGADAAFSNFHRSVDGHFNGMIKTVEKWQDKLNGVTHVATVTSAQIAGDFDKQHKAAGSATAGVDVLTAAIRSHGINSDQFHKARSTLVSDMTSAGVNAKEANKDIGDYTGAIIAHGLKSDQARAARLRMINDILDANKNSVDGKHDLDKYTSSVVQQGTKADATRAARKKLIQDLIDSGIDAKTAKSMVDGLEKSISKMTSKTVVLTMKGNGTYAINQAAARNTQNVKSPSGNFSTFIGHAATGTLVRAGTTSTADDVLVKVSKGELIVPANLVAAGAADNLRGRIPGFAKGGVVQDNKAVQNGTFPEKTYNQFAWQMTNSMADQMVKSINQAVMAAQAVGGPNGGPLGSGTSAGEMANGAQIFSYLLKNVFGGSAIAAAGATASIWGESTWNPFAQGTGGRGLIGWTPPGTLSDNAFRGGMATQLPAIIKFISSSGDWGVIKRMESSRSVFDAANLWGKGVERYGINDVHSQGIALATQIMAGALNVGTPAQVKVGHHAEGGLVGYAKGGTVKQTAAQRAAAADAKRVSKLELKPLATLKALDVHYKAKMAKDVKTRNYRDYYGSSLALRDVDKAIAGWVSPLQREHDADARGYRKYSSLASRAMASGNEKEFFKDSVQAAKYAAAIAKIDKKLNAQTTAGASSFVPLNIPLNRDYMTGFGQFGGQFRLGGTLPEGIIGRGVKSGMSYMMGAGERVVPPNSSAANPGTEMAQTNQLLLSLLAELKTANEIGKVTAQNTHAAAKGLGNVGRLVR
jgi:nucleoid DNA-binding protein